MTEPTTRPLVFGGRVQPFLPGDMTVQPLRPPNPLVVSTGSFPTEEPEKQPENVYIPQSNVRDGQPYVRDAIGGGYVQPDKYAYSYKNARAPSTGPVLDGTQAMVYYHVPGDLFKHYYIDPDDGARYVYDMVTGQYQPEGTRSTTNPNAGAWLVSQPLHMEQPPEMRAGLMPTAVPQRTSLVKSIVVPELVLPINLKTSHTPGMTYYKPTPESGGRSQEKWDAV